MLGINGKLRISASNVAAFIGRHPYKSQEEAFQITAEGQGLLKRDYVKERYKKELIEKHGESLNLAANSTGHETERNISMYEASVKNNFICDIIADTSTIFVPPEIKRKVKTQSLEASLQDKDVLQFMESDITLREACTEAQRRRGVRFEGVATDNLQSRLGQDITRRNAQVYTKRCDGFILVGKCDGLTGDAVVETKVRRRFWEQVPQYDIIQLRIYMKLCSKRSGLLNEEFPDGTTRTTEIAHDEKEWLRIKLDIYAALPAFYSYIESKRVSNNVR
jgi:hypothetical protein